MKKLLIVLLIAALLVSLAACTTAGNTPQTATAGEETAATAQKGENLSLRIMSFNLLYKDEREVTVANSDETADMRVSKRGPRMVEMLEDQKVDVLGVQEASEAWEEYISSGLPYEYDYVGERTSHTGEGGFVIYNYEKFDMLAWDWFCLSDSDNPHEKVIAWDADHDRLCTWVLLQEKVSGTYFLFADTHLDNNGEEARLNGAQLIIDNLNTLRAEFEAEYGVSIPVILVGDMNCETNSEAYNLLAENLTDVRHAAPSETVGDEVASSPLPAPYYTEDESGICKNSHFIDHMFVSSDVTVEYYNMIQTSNNLCPYGAYLSDHNAVYADITIHN